MHTGDSSSLQGSKSAAKRKRPRAASADEESSCTLSNADQPPAADGAPGGSVTTVAPVPILR